MKLGRSLSVFASLLIVLLAATIAQATQPGVRSNAQSRVTGPALTFSAATSANGYDSGGLGADKVVVADLDGDGIQDIVVCNTDSYSVFLGVGDGTFAFNNNYPSAGLGVNLCAVADLNGDGIPDIVATTNFNANSTGGGVDVLLGVGDGTFADPVSNVAGPIETFAIAVGDVNGDGIPDLVVTSNCQTQTCLNGNVIVLLGWGKGKFPNPAPIYITSGTGPIALADMNGDGILDIIYAGGVMLGDGTGYFNPVDGGELLGGAVSIAVGDVNGDGIPDVVAVSNNNQADVLLGNGDGTLTHYASYKTGGYWPLSVSLADLTGEGYPDLIVANECQYIQKGSGGNGKCNSIGQVSILTNKGGTGPSFAGFNPAQSFASGGYQASSVGVADLNGDGKPDLVVSNVCTTPNFNFACSTDGWAAVLMNTTSLATTTVLASLTNPAVIAQSVTLTATVSSATPIPDGGVVTFLDGVNQIGTGSTVSGVATLSTTFSSKGTHFLKATFAGDTWHASSTGSLNEVVNLDPSTTTVVSSPNPSTYKQAVTLTATVSSSAPGGPTGTVTFKNGAAGLGTATLVGGVATLSTTKLPVGSLTITANYNGDSQSAKSSGSTPQQVN